MNFRKKQLSIVIAAALCTLAVMSFDVMEDTGKAGKTGAPGEQTCATTCHTGSPLNDGTGSVSITSPDLVNWEYMPGDTYTINVTVSRTGNPLFGLGVECLTMDAVPQNAGTLLITNPSETHILTAIVNTVSRRCVTHQLNAGLTNDTKTFTFDWIAPSTNIGNVTFYVAGNAANNSGTKFGDHIYTTTQPVTPAAGASINDLQDPDSFRFFPNPANETLFLSFHSEPGETVTISLLTMDGKSAAEPLSITGNGSAQNTLFPLSPDLPAGSYLLLKTDGHGNVRTYRVILH